MKKILLLLFVASLAFGSYSPNTIVTDPAGVNKAAVKAASTVPAATDPSLVVSLSPNGATATVVSGAGSSIIGRVGIDQTTPGTTNGVQVNAALPAGTNLLGKVGFDQTTPGTTNGVQVNAALPAGTNLIGYTKVTDGSNFMPTMDLAARKGFQAITDGTNTAAVKGATTAAATVDPALVVTISPNSSGLSPIGTAQANAPVYNDYTSTSVTTSAYVQMVASTSNATNHIQVFDSSGQAIYLATGGGGSETNQIIIPPGGGEFPLAVAAGTRVSYKSVTGTANSGYTVINFYK